MSLASLPISAASPPLGPAVLRCAAERRSAGPSFRPFRLVAALLLCGSAVVLLAAALTPTGPPAFSPPPAAPDTTATDTTATDTTATDTTATDTTGAPAGVFEHRGRFRSPTSRDTARADTTVAAPRTLPLDLPTGAARQPDTTTTATSADTTAAAADTTAASADTLRLVPRYLPGEEGGGLFAEPRAVTQRTASVEPRAHPFWAPRLGNRWAHELSLDSTAQRLTVSERIGGQEVGAPISVSRAAYRSARRRRDLRANWRELAEQQARRRRQQSGDLGVSIVVPGGRQSAFTTVFGKNEVSLDINGQADINAGFDYRKSDEQAAVTGSASKINPAFKQDLRLGVTGSIGDKLQVDVDWDTQSQFDYQNQVKLRYSGYDDEIVQKIEAGNVFLETPSTLINGGQSLFGIKGKFQLGGLSLTTIASQQEGQSQSLSIEGGSESTEFDMKAVNYDEDSHFFLGYYFRNRWNDALSDPPAARLANGFQRITELDVFRLETDDDPSEDDVRRVAAVVDLGEAPQILTQADGYTAAGPDALPDGDHDQYSAAEIDAMQDSTDLGAFLESASRDQPVQTVADYQSGAFRRLQQGRDYVFDAQLGYLSLQQPLQANEALAVAYRYETAGGTHEVGQLTTGGNQGGANGERVVLKLLRSGSNLPPAPDADTGDGINPAAWYLQMRNIYKLRGQGFNEESFDLDLQYQAPGQTSQSRLPDIGGQQTLLELLGLDRLNEENAQGADGKFDFLNGFTINQREGLLIFPYLQPFGRRLREVIEDNSTGDPQALIDEFVFSNLYRKKQQTVEAEDAEFDLYKIAGSYKGAIKDFYDLEAFNGLVEGSVRVTSGGSELTEGADYQVDYQGGTVTILNDAYLAPGRDIEIEYEKNALLNLQKKTLLGARANYRLRDNLSVGATVMRLSQRSPADKLRIGQEPIKNTILGVDGSLFLEPRWLTRAVDALPLVQTKAPSSLEVTGEFAQLRPGHTETQAFERTRRRLQDASRDFTGDELAGVSYIDDFEGFENSFSLKAQVRNWHVAAAPPTYDPPGETTDDALARNNWRGTLAWYQLNDNIVDELSDAPAYNDAVKRLVEIQEVFPNRDTRGQVDNTLRTFDLYFDPAKRGPYNYTEDLQQFVNQPQEAWGGMTQHLPEGQTDFGVQNIEFVEFVFKPYSKGGDAGDEAALYVDLGSISEDVVPNAQLNAEDGLSNSDFSPATFDALSRLPTGQQNGTVDTDGQRTEDLGLDGVASVGASAYPAAATEEVQFGDFLSALPSGGSSRLRAEAARARRDPSGDDYHFYRDDAYFEDPELFPGGATFSERFTGYYPGQELNTFESQNTIAAATSERGLTRDPDSEDLNNDGIDNEDRYYEYRIPLSRAALDAQAQPEAVSDFVVGEISDENGNGTGWYQVRIPVRTPDKTTEGAISDFNLIESMRLWTTGLSRPMTLRFATLDLVGSQWRKSEEVALQPSEERAGSSSDTLTVGAPLNLDDSRLTIASINNEENSGVYFKPRRAVVGQKQLASGGQQNAREQALVLRVDSLRRNQQRAIFKTIQNLNLLKYRNLRLFAHLHSSAGDFQGMTEEEARRQVTLFVRLGANETGDFYEYEQPLTPTPETAGNPDELWLPQGNTVSNFSNEMNLRLSVLNQLKVARDRQLADSVNSVRLDEIFYSDADGVNLDPAPQSFAPQGTRLGIKGTPSLQDVSTVTIGLRTSSGSEMLLENLTAWVNELRVAGYDERNGWAATASTDIQLADLGRVTANFQTQTDGFGSLSSTLGERRQNDLFNWSLTADLNANKLLPGRYGWQIPVTLQLGSKTSTPRYAPNRGDVRVEDIINQVQEQDEQDYGDEEPTTRADVLDAAQTRNSDRTVTVGLQKEGSSSPWLRYTLDALNLNYNFSQSDANTPTREMEDRWSWNGGLDYQVTFDRPRTVQPFRFLEGLLGDLPVIGGLGSLTFNYVPQSVAFNAGASRNVEHTQDRTQNLFGGDLLPEPVRDNQSFTHERGTNIEYDPFEFLHISLNTSTEQSLNTLGADSLYRVVTADAVIREDSSGTPFANRKAARAYADSLAEDAFVEDRLDLAGTGSVLRGLFSGNDGPRTNNYKQGFAATLNLPFLESEIFNWIDLEDVAYDARYRWENGPRGRNLGATLGNDITLRSGLTLHPKNLWEKFGFYRALQTQQEEAQQEKAQQETQREEAQGDEEAPGAEQTDAEQTGAEQTDAEQTGEEQTGAEQTEGAQDEGEAAPEEGEEESGPKAGSERSFSDLPLPDPVNLLRRFALGVTGIEDFSFTYSSTRSAQSNYVGSGDYTLLDAVQGNGPPLGYRFGWTRRIGREGRVDDDEISIRDDLVDQNELEARTTLSFSRNFRVDLDWNVEWNDNATTLYPDPGASRAAAGHSETTRDGGNTSSVWAFGASYRDFFKRQLETYRSDVNAIEEGAEFRDPDGDGRTALTNATLSSDFRSAFASSMGGGGQGGFLLLPVPGWTVTYSGLSDWPILRSFTQSATLRHGYNAEYTSDFSTLTGTSEDSFTLFDETIFYDRARYSADGLGVSERYQPLMGLDVSWNGSLQTKLDWNRTNNYRLRTAGNEIIENNTDEIALTASYRKQGLNLSFLPFIGDLENQISLSLTASRATNDERRFLVRRALEDARANLDDFSAGDALKGENVSTITQTTRLQVTPKVTYRISNRVSADFVVRYERFKGNRRPSYTNIDGGFNVRVSIQD